MVRSVFLSCVLLCVAACVVSAFSGARTELYIRDGAPRGWERLSEASGTLEMQLTFAVKQQNVDKLEAVLLDISDPASSNYGEWRTRDQIMAIIEPKQEHKMLVEKWISMFPDSQFIDLGDAYRVATTVETVELMFQTKIFMYEHSTTQMQVARHFGSFSMPAELSEAIELITGVSDFPVHRQSKRRPVAAGDGAYVIPWTVKMLYNVPFTWTYTAAGASQNAVEFVNYGAFLDSDLSTFCINFASDLNGDVACQQSYTVVGNFNASAPADESTLDVEYLYAISSTATSVYWTDRGWIYDFALNLVNDATPPLVSSLSYGWIEIDQCDVANVYNCSQQGWTQADYVSRSNTELMKVGTLGLTVIVASGDQGAPGPGNPNCAANVLYPVFPAASPYVTTVGATMLTSNTWIAEESAAGVYQAPQICFGDSLTCANNTASALVACAYPASGITSGGGFSAYAAQPTWQSSVVTSYLHSGVALPSPSLFTATNRAYPDVAVIGDSFIIVINGNVSVEDGTSAATPSFAAMIAMLNQYQLSLGHAALGFINPLLYSMAAAQPNTFTDVVSGNNKCTETACCSIGYMTARGWDPVTGLGSPNFGNMLSYIQSSKIGVKKR
eukprot:TRINITY_DN6700_c0_g1_i1.p1 TRINITY_DN6700_c0_g1~~TRINITY_DN6700_c0_g1_i1.p1  ORF type:complete len:615 (-),score=127.44 TRINITY_DN6700_c0_g1_i1:91-1935(-)